MSNCFYCNAVAAHQFKNGKYCCSAFLSQCPEVRKTISEKNSGKNHPLYGKNKTEETKQKFRESMKGNIPWNKSTHKGKVCLEKFEGNEEVTSDQSGVYAIRNLITRKVYIGSATNLQDRKRSHLQNLMHGRHGNIHLQRSFDLYGADSFDFRVVEFVKDPNLLVIREQFWIDQFSLREELYNICKIAASTRGKKHSGETREKMSQNRGRYYGQDNSFYGKRHSEEAKELMASKAKGRRQSAECVEKRLKTIENKYGKSPWSRRVNQLNAQTGELIKTWDSMTEASKTLGVRVSGISLVCTKTPTFHKNKGKSYVTKTAGGYKWEFAS